jgi:hypothetical protein
MYREAIELGSEPDHEAVRTFARRHFSYGLDQVSPSPMPHIAP